MKSRRRAKQKTHLVTSIGLPALCGRKGMHDQLPVTKSMIDGIKEAEEQGHDNTGYCVKCYSFLKKDLMHRPQIKFLKHRLKDKEITKTDQLIESKLLSRTWEMDVFRNIIERIHNNANPKTNTGESIFDGLVDMRDIHSLLEYATRIHDLDLQITTIKQLENY